MKIRLKIISIIGILISFCCQSCAEPRNLVERKEVLNKIKNHFNHKGKQVLFLSGISGIGKTTLAKMYYEGEKGTFHFWFNRDTDLSQQVQKFIEKFQKKGLLSNFVSNPLSPGLGLLKIQDSLKKKI